MTKMAGTGVGIANVCQRLSARFGRVGQLRLRADGDGGYSVLLTCAGSIGWVKRPGVLIADDEPLAAERLQLLLAKCEASIWSARRPTATARLE